MACLQLHRVAMGVRPQLSLGMPAMGCLKHRNLLPIHLLMDRLSSHPALLGVMDSLDIPIHSHHLLVMLSQIQVLNVHHHPIMVLQLSQVMEVQHMVHHQEVVRQVMVRGRHLTTMVVGIHSLYTLLMGMQHLLLSLFNRVE